MPNLSGHEWDGKLARPPWNWGDKTRLAALKSEISTALKELQGEYCAYCGMRFDVTSSSQIEHIAPKGNGRYPEFMFNVSNLVHACSLCNGFEKKEADAHFDTIAVLDANYELCAFNIVHPYFDDPEVHFRFTQAANRVLITHLTAKGQKSIEVFQLDGEALTSERGKMVMVSRYNMDPVFRQAFEDALIRRAY
jgi:uncharacterized protein (TIGR02646 family)